MLFCSILSMVAHKYKFIIAINNISWARIRHFLQERICANLSLRSASLIEAVWSEISLSARRRFEVLSTNKVSNEASDQTARKAH